MNAAHILNLCWKIGASLEDDRLNFYNFDDKFEPQSVFNLILKFLKIGDKKYEISLLGWIPRRYRDIHNLCVGEV